MPAKQSRPRNYNPEQRYAWVFALGDNEREHIDAVLITRRISALQLARDLKTRHEHLAKQNDTTIAKRLRAYQKNHLGGKLFRVDSEVHGNSHFSTVYQFESKIDHRVDPYASLEELILLQTDRVNRAYGREIEKGGALTKEVRLNITTLSRLLVEAADLQFELGIAIRVPKKIKQQLTLELSGNEDAQVSKTMQTQDQKLLATHKVFKLIEGINEIDEGEFFEIGESEVVYVSEDDET